MGFVAVHCWTGATVHAANRRPLRVAELATGLATGRWVEFPTRIEGQTGGFVAPPRPPDDGIGRRRPDPLGWRTPRRYPVDDHPVGTHRV